MRVSPPVKAAFLFPMKHVCNPEAIANVMATCYHVLSNSRLTDTEDLHFTSLFATSNLVLLKARSFRSKMVLNRQLVYLLLSGVKHEYPFSMALHDGT